MSSSAKKIIPIIIVAVIAIGALAVISNPNPISDQANEIDQVNTSPEIEQSIQEIIEDADSESPPTNELETSQDQTSGIEKTEVSSEMSGPIQEVKETFESEPKNSNSPESKQIKPKLRAVF